MTTNETILNEASRKLTAYINTGIAGFFTQATDRMRAAGIDTSKYTASKASAAELLNHLHTHYTIR